MSKINPKSAPNAAPARSGLQRMPATAPAMRSPAGDAIVTRGGKLQRLAAKVTLRSSEKHIYTVDGGKTFTIQGEGYAAIQKALGLKFVMAPDVVVDGMVKQNPYIVRDEASNTIRDVFMCAALVGRAENGEPITLVETLNFSPVDYFDSELIKHCGGQSSWKNNQKVETGFSEHGRLDALDRVGPLADHEVLYPIDEQVGAVMDLRSSKVTDILQTKQENLKFATRKAQTMLFRRLCAKHPAMPSQHISGDRVMVTWEHKPGGRDSAPVRVKQAEKPSQYAKVIEAEVTINVLSWVEMPGAAAETDRIVAAIMEGDSAELDSIATDLGYSTARDADEDVAKVTIVDTATGEIHDGEDDQDFGGDDSEGPEDAPEDDGAAPFSKAQLQLANDCNGLLARLRRKRGGSRQAADLLGVHVDPDLPLEEQEEKRLLRLKSELEKALAPTPASANDAEGGLFPQEGGE